MQVILLERVEKLGTIGDEVNVKNGFARNFLIPQGKALLANNANRARFEREREAIEARNSEAKAAAESTGGSLSGVSLSLSASLAIQVSFTDLSPRAISLKQPPKPVTKLPSLKFALAHRSSRLASILLVFVFMLKSLLIFKSMWHAPKKKLNVRQLVRTLSKPSLPSNKLRPVNKPAS